MKWVEGIHYEKLEDGTLRCLNCEKILKGLPGLGPHLAACWKPEVSKGEGVGTKEVLPDEVKTLGDILDECGVKTMKPAILRKFARLDPDDLQGIERILRMAQVTPAKKNVILENWADHRHVTLPQALVERLPASQHGGEYLTKSDLDAYFIKKEEGQRLTRIEGTLRSLVEGNPEKKSDEVKDLKGEIADLRKSLHATEIGNLEKRLSDVENRSTSDLQTAIVETGKVVSRLGDRVETIAMASQGFVESNVPLNESPNQEASQGIKAALREHGLVTRIREEKR